MGGLVMIFDFFNFKTINVLEMIFVYLLYFVFKTVIAVNSFSKQRSWIRLAKMWKFQVKRILNECQTIASLFKLVFFFHLTKNDSSSYFTTLYGFHYREYT